MNKVLQILSFLLLFIVSTTLAETLDFSDLVKRDGYYYKRFSDIPFTGNINARSIF